MFFENGKFICCRKRKTKNEHKYPRKTAQRWRWRLQTRWLRNSLCYSLNMFRWDRRREKKTRRKKTFVQWILRTDHNQACSYCSSCFTVFRLFVFFFRFIHFVQQTNCYPRVEKFHIKNYSSFASLCINLAKYKFHIYR